VNYPEAIQFLYGLRLFGAKFGLDNTIKLAALAGNPQEKLRFIHVAGTNGKGSTCAMLEAIYRAGGWRTGLFTSPHLVSFRERIQVNRQLISENDVVRLVAGLQPLLGQFPAGHHPTFFEVLTVMALKFFAEQKCDLVIWETGLGGRLDATNIVTPLASVITNIAMDHQQWLGDTLEKIAFEKAGIIKPGVPVITSTDEPEALAMIQKVAKEKGSLLTIAGADANSPSRSTALSRDAAMPLPGEHQRINASLALATVDALQKHVSVAEKKILAGLANVHWPGRLQLVQRQNGREILLDGAHNVAGAKVLANALNVLLPVRKPGSAGVPPAGQEGTEETRRRDASGPRPSLVLGVLQDKDWQQICGVLAPLAKKIIAVPVSSERTADPGALAEECRQQHPDAEVSVGGSLKEALEKTNADDFVIVTGSLYLVGEALELLGQSPAANSERALNEWTAAQKMP